MAKTVDEWAQEICELNLIGTSVNELVVLVTYCSQIGLEYRLTIPAQNANAEDMRFTMTVKCTNLQAFQVRNDYLAYKNQEVTTNA